MTQKELEEDRRRLADHYRENYELFGTFRDDYKGKKKWD